MSDTVLMRSPEGEVRSVESLPELLTPLMVLGWQQIFEEVNDADQNAESAIRDRVPAAD